MTYTVHTKSRCIVCHQPQGETPHSRLPVRTLHYWKGPAMTTQVGTHRAPFGSVAYLAGEYLHRNGPATEAELYVAVDFGCKAGKRAEKLQNAVTTGWLVQGPDNKFDIGRDARVFFNYKTEDAEEPRPVGQAAAPRDRSNVFTRPALDKKHIPNSRGLRQDVPAWSVRPADFCMKSIAGSEG